MGIVWENTTPSTELSRDFSARIGPLQLGVVLVLNWFNAKCMSIYMKCSAADTWSERLAGRQSDLRTDWKTDGQTDSKNNDNQEQNA